MARFGVNIAVNEETTEQRPQYENLPAGVYRLEISTSEIKCKNEGTREKAVSWSTTMDVVEPDDFRGRKLFTNYNLEHPTAQAQEIGQKQFSALRRAMGKGNVGEDEDTEEMHLEPFIATVGMGRDSKEKNGDGSPKYAARAEIKRYWYPDIGDAPPIGITAARGGVTAANDNNPAAKIAAEVKPAGAKPWAKKAA